MVAIIMNGFEYKTNKNPFLIEYPIIFTDGERGFQQIRFYNLTLHSEKDIQNTTNTAIALAR